MKYEGLKLEFLILTVKLKRSALGYLRTVTICTRMNGLGGVGPVLISSCSIKGISRSYMIVGFPLSDSIVHDKNGF